MIIDSRSSRQQEHWPDIVAERRIS